jgi:hypothetical protein
MKSTIAVLTACLVSLLTLNAVAEEANSLFTLQGKDRYSPRSCFLFVDQMGYDRTVRGRNQFFAEVRTSYLPSQSYRLVADFRKPLTLMSVDQNGLPTFEMEIRLGSPANAKALHRAKDYNWNGFVCAMLRHAPSETNK